MRVAMIFFVYIILCVACMQHAMEGLEKVRIIIPDDQVTNCSNIECLITKYGNLYACAHDSEGNTPLHKLLASDRVWDRENKIRLLLQYNASLTVDNNQGMTPIHVAARYKRDDFLRSFLHRIDTKDINKQSRGDGITALDFALFVSSYSTIEYLVAHGAITCSPKSRMNLSIHQNANNGKYAIVKLLYEHNPMLLDNTEYGDFNCKNLTPLNSAVMGLSCLFTSDHGIKKTVEFLLDKRASTTMADSDGNIPLHHAACAGIKVAHSVMKQLLYYNNICVDIQNGAGDTPLHKIIDGAHIDSDNQWQVYVKHTNLLLSCNATLDIRNGLGKTALHKAVKRDHEKMVALLLEKRASCLIADNKANLPIHIAAFGKGKNSCAIVDLLVHASIPSINHCNKDGNTPLHMAALGTENRYWNSNKQIERCEYIARVLLLNDADKTGVNNEKKTALDIAGKFGSANMTCLLELDVKSYKKMREHNAELMKRAASILGNDASKLKSNSKYQQLLDFEAL